jgi:sodium/proline symporter
LIVPDAGNHEQILFSVTNLLFDPIVAGMIIAAVLSAIMSTADSQLLVSASSLSYDLQQQKSARNTLVWSRITVAIMCLISASIALYAPEAIFSRVLFAWAAIGSAFGPLLIVLLLFGKVRGSYRFYSILCGFGLTVLLNWFSESPGSILERCLPFLLAFLIAWMGSNKQT